MGIVFVLTLTKDERRMNEGILDLPGLRIKEIVLNSNEQLILNESGDIIIYDKQFLIGYSVKIKTLLLPIFNQLIEKHHYLIRKRTKART